MSKEKIKEKVNEIFKNSELEVVYATSDGVTFSELFFAQKHADKNRLKVYEFTKPKKKVRNGSK